MPVLYIKTNEKSSNCIYSILACVWHTPRSGKSERKEWNANLSKKQKQKHFTELIFYAVFIHVSMEKLLSKSKHINDRQTNETLQKWNLVESCVSSKSDLWEHHPNSEKQKLRAWIVYALHKSTNSAKLTYGINCFLQKHCAIVLVKKFH